MTNPRLFPLVALLAGLCPARAADVPSAATNPFFAFCMDVQDAKKRSLPEQAELLKELGYDGAGHLWLENVPERLQTLDAAGLKLFQITTTLDLTPGKPAYEPALKEVLPLLKGRHVQIDLLINGLKPGDPAGQARAIAVLRELSDMAKDSGTVLLLYHHTGSWLDRIEDAVRLADKIDRPNVQVMFNLCHWLRVEKSRDYRAALKLALPRLGAVSINGAEQSSDAPDWSGYIQPLGHGSFDVFGFLRALRELGYSGPIGLQCYGLGGDARVHLAESMKAWRDYSARLPALPPSKAAAPSARAVSPEPRDQVDGHLIQFNDNGSWCWYQDQRALVDKARGKLIIGSVASKAGPGGDARDGNVEAVIYDLHSGSRQRSVLATGDAHRFGCDDHDAPAFLLRPDGKYLAMYTGHNKDDFSYYRIYSGDAWGPERAFDWNARPGGADFPTTYSNPHYLPGEGRLYNFARGTGHGSQNIMLSTNLGDTWSYAGLMTTNAGIGYVNGYFTYRDDGQRIDFICTEFHPRDFNTSIYHGYVSNGQAFNSAGTVVNSNIFSQSPVAPQSFTPVFRANSVLPSGQTNSRCWNMDVRRFPDGSISALLSARVNDTPDQPSQDPDHAFLYCRYDGRSWGATYLCQAGKKLFRHEQDYTGLAALAPDDPTVIYISTPYDPRDNATFLGVHEIFKGITANHGATFAWTPVTQHSTRDNLRPIVPAWDKNHTALLWWRGTSFTSQRFDAAVVGLILRRD